MPIRDYRVFPAELTVRADTSVAIQFQLLSGTAPIDLASINKIELRYRDRAGVGALVDNATGGQLSVNGASGGSVQWTPDGGQLVAGSAPYTGYFLVYPTADTSYAVPEANEFNIFARSTISGTVWFVSMRSYDIVQADYAPFSGRAFLSSASVTRPANTTQYSAGDQVAGATASPDALNFGTCAVENGGGGVIAHATCIDRASQNTKPNLRLYLFSGSPTLSGDNAAWNPGSADIENVLGVVEFSVWEVGGTGSGTAGNCFSEAKNLNIPYRCGSGENNLWGALVERGTYSPVASEAFTVKLGVIHD